MDDDLYQRLRVAITCGKLDCLKGCCGANLSYVLAAIRETAPQDDELIQHMLCGCVTGVAPAPKPTDIVPIPPVRPPSDNCVTRMNAWINQHGGAMSGLQSVLEMLSAVALSPEYQVIVEKLKNALRVVIAARSASEREIERLMTQICSALRVLDAGRKRLAQAIPEALTPVRDALNWVDLERFVSLGCCPGTNVGDQIPGWDDIVPAGLPNGDPLITPAGTGTAGTEPPRTRYGVPQTGSPLDVATLDEAILTSTDPRMASYQAERLARRGGQNGNQ